MIINELSERIKVALRNHDTLTLDTLRGLSTALKYAQIDKMRDLTLEEEQDVIRKEAKKRSDAIEAYTKIGASDRVAREEDELKIIKNLLPEELTRDEIELIVKEGLESGLSDFGSVMRFAMSKVAGRADGRVVSEIVKSKLLI